MGNFSYYKHLRLYLPYQLRPPYFKRILGFPQAIGVPLVSAIFVFIFAMGSQS